MVGSDQSEELAILHQATNESLQKKILYEVPSSNHHFGARTRDFGWCVLIGSFCSPLFFGIQHLLRGPLRRLTLLHHQGYILRNSFHGRDRVLHYHVDRYIQIEVLIHVPLGDHIRFGIHVPLGVHVPLCVHFVFGDDFQLYVHITLRILGGWWWLHCIEIIL